MSGFNGTGIASNLDDVQSTLSVKSAQSIIKTVDLLRQIGVNSDAIVWPEVERMYQDARIVLLEDEIQQLDDEAQTLTNSVSEGILLREHLREDVQRLLDINARQAKTIQDLQFALDSQAADIRMILDGNKLDVPDPILTSEVLVDAGDHTFSLWGASNKFKTGDKIILNHLSDLLSNGSYVFGEDKIFHKVSE